METTSQSSGTITNWILQGSNGLVSNNGHSSKDNAHCPYSRAATVLVDESFGFIDYELDETEGKGSVCAKDGKAFESAIVDCQCVSIEVVDCPRTSTSHDGDIVRCADQEGELCAIYEKRSVINNARRFGATFIDQGPCVSVNDGRPRTGRNEDAYSSTGQGFIRRLRKAIRWGRVEKKEDISCISIDPPIIDLSTSNLYSLHNTGLKINPLYYRGNGIPYDYYYCDSRSAVAQNVDRDPPLRAGVHSSAFYEMPPVHSKADRTMIRRDLGTSTSNIERVNTKQFGIAVTIMVCVFALGGIGIGMTIYFD